MEIPHEAGLPALHVDDAITEKVRTYLNGPPDAQVPEDLAACIFDSIQRFAKGICFSQSALPPYCDRRSFCEDLAIECWIQVQRKLALYRFESSFDAWLRGVVANKFRDMRRIVLRGRREMLVNGETLERNQAVLERDEVGELSSPTFRSRHREDPSQVLQEKEDQKTAVRVIKEHAESESGRRCARMIRRWIKGATLAEIAVIVERSERQVQRIIDGNYEVYRQKANEPVRKNSAPGA